MYFCRSFVHILTHSIESGHQTGVLGIVDVVGSCLQILILIPLAQNARLGPRLLRSWRQSHPHRSRVGRKSFCNSNNMIHIGWRRGPRDHKQEANKAAAALIDKHIDGMRTGGQWERMRMKEGVQGQNQPLIQSHEAWCEPTMRGETRQSSRPRSVGSIRKAPLLLRPEPVHTHGGGTF